MIYINQEGVTELGRGETREAAIIDALKNGFFVNPSEIKRAFEERMDGDVYWTDEPERGYNGVSHYEIELRDRHGVLIYAGGRFTDNHSLERETFDNREEAESTLLEELQRTLPTYSGYVIEHYFSDEPGSEREIGRGRA